VSVEPRETHYVVDVGDGSSIHARDDAASHDGRLVVIVAQTRKQKPRRRAGDFCAGGTARCAAREPETIRLAALEFEVI
jgi:hypothetical protein